MIMRYGKSVYQMPWFSLEDFFHFSDFSFFQCYYWYQSIIVVSYLISEVYTFSTKIKKKIPIMILFRYNLNDDFWH